MKVVTDALGRPVQLSGAPRRVVSLVPSETESVVDLAGIEVLVGRTSFCVEPAGRVEHVPTCGGTKDVDIEAVLALAPDLVLANQEENARPAIEALIARGAPVHVSFPRTVAEGVGYVHTLACLLGLDPDRHEVVRSAEAALADARDRTGSLPTFVPIWVGPWMTIGDGTFASDMLAVVGAANVFTDRERRYPLAADIGTAPAWPKERVGERDTRYPRVTLDEVRTRAPRLVLLPDEPYAFTAADAQTLRDHGIDAAVEFIDGKNIFWYGTRIPRALRALRAIVDRHST